MKKILLLLSPSRQSKKSVDVAFDIVEKEKAFLVVLFILDEELSENVIKKLSEENWMARTVSEPLHNAILKEYAFSGKLKIKAILSAAQKRNIPCKVISKRGSFCKEALLVISEEEIDTVVVTTKHRSSISKFLFGSILGELKKKFKGEVVEVVDPT